MTQMKKKKKRQYDYRVITVEKGTPLVFSVFGTSAPEYKKFLRSLFTKIAEKRSERYSDVANWVRCK